MTITDSPTETPTVCVGQTWKRNGYGFRHLVLDTPEVEGIRMVLYRLDCDRPGEDVRCATVDEFLAEHEDPQWPTPAPEDREEYAAVVLYDGGDGPHLRRPYAALGDAIADAEGLPEHIHFVGIQRVRTKRTFEWVRNGEIEGGE